MDKLITNQNGGYPFVLDDLRFADDSVREALAGICRPYGGATYADGFIMTNNKDYGNFDGSIIPGLVFPEQFVFMENEIWYLPAYTTPTSTTGGSFLWIVPDIAFTGTTPGQKVFLNGSTNETYQKRRAKIVQHTDNTTVPAGQIGGFCFGGYFFNEWRIDGFKTSIGRFKDQSGITDIKTDISTANYNISVNSSDILNLENKVDDIESEWTTITGIDLKYNLHLCKLTNPSTVASDWATLPTRSDVSVGSGSFLKYKTIGKTMLVNFFISDLVIPLHSNFPVGGLLMTFSVSGFSDPLFLGSTSFSGSCAMHERNMTSPGSHIGELMKGTNQNGKNGIFIRGNRMNEYSGIAWGYDYFQSVWSLISGNQGVATKGSEAYASTVQGKYYLRGSVVFETL